MLQTLLVDDDILSLNKLQTFLADLGLDPYVCGQPLDGTSAIEFLKLHGNSVDIIILDMEMPGIQWIRGSRIYPETSASNYDTGHQQLR